MFLWCVRDEWRQGQTAILTQLLFLTKAALLPHLGRSCSTGGRWGPRPSVCKLALTLAFLWPTNSTATSTCLCSFITHTCFCFFFRLFTQVHLWLTARSRINLQHMNQSSVKQPKIFSLKLPAGMLFVQHAVSKFLDGWFISWCDSSLLPSRKKP